MSLNNEFFVLFKLKYIIKGFQGRMGFFMFKKTSFVKFFRNEVEIRALAFFFSVCKYYTASTLFEHVVSYENDQKVR